MRDRRRMRPGSARRRRRWTAPRPRPRPLAPRGQRAARTQPSALRTPSPLNPLPNARDSAVHGTRPPELGEVDGPRSSAAPGPLAPQPAINPSDYARPTSRATDRRSQTGPVPADSVLEFGPWVKGPAWARASGLLGLCLLVFVGCWFFGSIGWGLAILGCGLGLVLLLTLRTGLSGDPQARGYFHPEEGMSDRRWYRLQRSLLRRIGLRLQLLLSHVADWVLTILWRQIRRIVRRRFR